MRDGEELDGDPYVIMHPRIEPGQRWRHWKGGTYRIITTGYEEETGNAIVVYKSESRLTVWSRPLSDFYGMVKGDDAPSPSVARFTFIKPSMDDQNKPPK